MALYYAIVLSNIERFIDEYMRNNRKIDVIHVH